MRKIIFCVFLLCSTCLSCSLESRELEDKEMTLDLHYISFGCECARWAEGSDINKYIDTGSLSDHTIFVEPADSSLTLPDSLGYSGDIVKFTGSFYVLKGYPANYIMNEEPVDKARVFRYTSFKVLRSGYREFLNDSKSDTTHFDLDKGRLSEKSINLQVNYGGIACSCAQWVETKALADSFGERQYFYLEKGKEGILDADTIFNGSNLPVQLLLKGQFYGKIGYPENYNPGKEEPPPARVFRYSSIKVIH